MNSRTTVDLIINGQQAEERLRTLRNNALQLESALAKAASAGDKATLKSLRRELTDTRRQIREVESATMQVETVMKRLDKATPRELQQTLKTLNKQLEGLERGTEAWTNQINKIRSVKQELKEVRQEMEPEEGIVKKIQGRFEEFQTAIVGVGATITGLVMAGKSAVQAYADMEGEMANVRKFTGMSAEEVERLNEAFKGMDTRTSREDLNKMAEEAGRLGKNSIEDVLGYVRAADQLNVALDDLGEGATLTLSKLTGIFGDEKRLGTEKSLLAVGSVINELSQNCSASAPYLAEFASRMGGVGAQAGLTVQQIMAYGAVLDTNNQALEASATALSQVITRIYQEPDKYAKVAGLDATKFAKTVKTDMNEAIIMLMEALQKAGNMDVLSPMFKDMGENGSRAISTLATLAGHIDDVKAQQVNANQAFSEATSVTGEFNVKNNTVQASLDKAKKGFKEMAVELGEKLRPAMSMCISSTSLMMKAMLQAVKFIMKYKGEIITLGTAIAAYTLIVKAATLYEKAHTAAKVIAATVTKGYTVVVGTLKAAQIALSHAMGVLRANWAKQSAAMAEAKIAGTSLAQGYAAIVAAVVVLGTAIYEIIQRQKEHLKALREQREAQRKFAADARDISQAAADSAAAETAALKQLYEQAVSEANSKDLRRQAAEKLQAMYPSYFANLSAEDIMLGKAKTQYDNLCQSILNVAKARAASEKIKENMKQILELEEQLQQGGVWLGNANHRVAQSQHAVDAAKEKADKTVAITPSWADQLDAGVAQRSAYSGVREPQKKLNKDTEDRNAALRYISQRRNKLKALNKANEELARQYGDQEGFDLSEPDMPKYGEGTGYTQQKDGKKGGKETGKTTPEKKTDPFQKEKEWKDEQEAYAKIAYARGETNYATYTNRMGEIEVEYYEKMLQHTDLKEKERLDIQAKYEEARRHHAEEDAKAWKEYEEGQHKKEVDEEKNAYEEKLAAEKQRYIDGKIDKQTYEATTHILELQHLKAMVGLTKQGTKERLDAERAYQEAVLKDQQQRQEQQENELKEHQQRLKEIKKNVFGMTRQEKKQAYNQEVQDLKEVYAQMIQAAEGNKDDIEKINKAYAVALKALGKKFDQIGEDQENPIKRTVEGAAEWLKGEGGQTLTQGLDVAVSQMSAIFSGLTSLIQAETEIQTAAIEKKYDREISLAEGNTYMEKVLEKQKQEEVAKVKNEAAKKQYKMQVMLAIAQTAQAALNAYSSAAAIPIIGWVMAPIAAATAVAAGMIQVAALKKQQKASEAQGYEEGGFTIDGAHNKVAGVVHAGEWVASQKLVKSPVARPLIDALDYAQRNNAIGRLSAQDVSATITAPTVIAQRQPTVVMQEQKATSQRRLENTITRLNKRLEEPFITVNTVTGEGGMQQAQEEYKRLMRNKTPKSKQA